MRGTLWDEKWTSFVFYYTLPLKSRAVKGSSRHYLRYNNPGIWYGTRTCSCNQLYRVFRLFNSFVIFHCWRRSSSSSLLYLCLPPRPEQVKYTNKALLLTIFMITLKGPCSTTFLDGGTRFIMDPRGRGCFASLSLGFRGWDVETRWLVLDWSWDLGCCWWETDDRIFVERANCL